MRITQATLQELQAQGIEAKIYPHATYDEWYKECWKDRYDYAYNYSKDSVIFTCGKLRKYTHEELDLHARQFADTAAKRKANNWYDSTVLYIVYEGRIIRKKENVKGKGITTEYVLRLIEKDRKAYQGTYGKFAEQMQSLLASSGFGNFGVIYPTTYGIGVWAFFNFNFDKCQEAVNKLLNAKGIKYRNEWSEREYVFRYVISKEKSNIDKINN